MNEIVFDLDLITPMFLMADNPRGQPVLRAAPIRGEMRYWLRALCAGSVPALKQAEANVFGDTRAGSVLSVWNQPWQAAPLTQASVPMLPHRIAAGGNALLTQAFEAEQSICLGLRGRPGLPLPPDGLKAFWLWLNLGGVGKRARRGFGSLQCRQVSAKNACLSEELRRRFGDPPHKEGDNPTRANPQADRYALADGDALVAQIADLLAWVSVSAGASQAETLDPTHFQIAPYPCFRERSWAVVVGRRAFPDYPAAMKDFWTDHLRYKDYLDEVAYGQADPRRASPLHLHCAKTKAGYHLVLTMFFTQPFTPAHKNKQVALLQSCRKAYNGAVFFS